MRIIAGKLKGRVLHSIKGRTTRPTSDKLRESIFNILLHHSTGSIVLDLFAGTGALGIEALSRGAQQCCFIDKDKEAIAIIHKNIASCSLKDKSQVIRWDIKKNLNCLKNLKKTFDLVFMDPPYNNNLIEPALHYLHQSGTLQTRATIVVEHAIDESIPGKLENYKLIDQRDYRRTLLSILNYND